MPVVHQAALCQRPSVDSRDLEMNFLGRERNSTVGFVVFFFFFEKGEVCHVYDYVGMCVFSGRGEKVVICVFCGYRLLSKAH